METIRNGLLRLLLDKMCGRYKDCEKCPYLELCIKVIEGE